MPIGIGTEIVDQSRLFKNIAEICEKYLSIVEKNEYLEVKDKLNFLAKRLAAKRSLKSALKDFATKVPPWFDCCKASVVHDKKGKPDIIFDDDLYVHLTQIGFTNCHISMSDDLGFVLGFVVIK